MGLKSSKPSVLKAVQQHKKIKDFYKIKQVHSACSADAYSNTVIQFQNGENKKSIYIGTRIYIYLVSSFYF
jgi:hypothetical protein